MAKPRSNKKRASKETREADAFMQTSEKVIDWIGENKGPIIAALLIFVLIGGGIAGVGQYQQYTEKKAQTDLFRAEKLYDETEEKFDEAKRIKERQEEIASSAKKTSKKDDEPKADELTAEDKAKLKNLPSGEFDQDYGNVVAAYQNVIKTHSGTHAAATAAINLARLYFDFDKTDLALKTLGDYSSNVDSGDFTYGLYNFLWGQILEAKNDCDNAITKWQMVEASQKSSFLHPQALLAQGICHQTKQNLDKAEELFEKTQKDFKDSAAAKKAKSFLRLLKLRKSTQKS